MPTVGTTTQQGAQQDSDDNDDGWDDEEGSLGESDKEDGAPEGAGTEADFYDPELDDRDEAWMMRQRGGRKSDAILSCPGCLTTVCLDCQQHHVNDGQFRAMFCINVR